MKKIGIVTYQNCNNYGAVLQTYASQEYYNKIGFNPMVINYHSKYVDGNDSLFGFTNFYYGWKLPFKIIEKLFKVVPNFKRKQNFKTFSKENLILSPVLKTKQQMENYVKDFDYVITGSDQVWNKNITRKDDDIYMLNINTNAKKMSYAASIGQTDITLERISEMRTVLKKYHSISVREESAKELLKMDNITCVLDPVFLLTQEEWTKKLKIKKNTEEYIFVYTGIRNKELLSQAEKISKALNIKLKVIYGNKVKGHEDCYSSNPKDFVELIANASYVMTDSFHGTAFSIIFKKKILVFINPRRGTRLHSILNIFNISDRIYNSNMDSAKKIMEEIDYKNVVKVFDKEIKKSKKFIDDSLKDGNKS